MESLLLTVVKWLIRWKFPTIPRLSTRQLSEKLAASSHPVLLDARSEVEYAVSHLPCAQRVPAPLPVSLLEELSPEMPIVVYCSVGYRSARVAQHLQQAGFQQVWNLEGGLFEWVNQGRSLVQNGQPIQQVHPYDATWGKLLKPDKRFFLGDLPP